MYFTIEKNQRNNGYGSKILKKLTRSYKNVLLCIEKKVNKYPILSKKENNFI